MAWADRVGGKILLRSPLGSEYSAFWRSNTKEMNKNVGVLSLPGRGYSVTQELGANNDLFVTEVIFSGANNDIESSSFFKACREPGIWDVTHPVSGLLKARIVNASIELDPTASGNMTVVTVSFIAVLDSTGDDSNRRQVESDNANDVMLIEVKDKFIGSVTQNTLSETKSLADTTNSVLGLFHEHLGGLTSDVADLNKRILSISSGISDAILRSFIDTTSLVGQLELLITLPALSSKRVSTQLSSYGGFVTNVLNLNASKYEPPEGRNVSAIKEVSASFVLSAINRVADRAEFISRSEPLRVIDFMSSLVKDMSDKLEKDQGLTSDVVLKDRYIFGGGAYGSIIQLEAATNAYLLVRTFDLAFEKKIRVLVPTPPIVIAAIEYDGLGSLDSNLIFFIESNNLTGNSIILIPENSEVSVYV